MRETGTVQSVSGNFCNVVVTRKSACGDNCANCKGGCSLKNQICIAKNDIGAAPGDKVVIEISTEKVLKSAFMVYILPIIVFFIVYFAVSNFSPLAPFIAVCAMACVFVLLFFHDKRSKSEFISTVCEILEK